MKSNQYIFSSPKNKSELQELKQLFDMVFTEENVGDMAVSITEYLPGMDLSWWYTARESETNQLVAACARPLWHVQLDDIPLKVWEQAIVGTHPSHRRQGLMKELNARLDVDSIKNDVDMMIIQGIPDFYRRFGYRYALAMENHINLNLDTIKDIPDVNARKASLKDYPLFEKEDKKRSGKYFVKTDRSEKNWDYYFDKGSQTEYSSEIWILTIQNRESYVKIQHHGFGEGLIVSELNDDMTGNQLENVLSFLKKKAIELQKPYIRFNLPFGIPFTQELLKKGALVTEEYGWQVKIPDSFRFIEKIRPSLQKRLDQSDFRESGNFVMNMAKETIALSMEKGKITGISKEFPKKNWPLILPRDLFEPLVLGYRSSDEIRRIRPDLKPFGNEAENLLQILFPEQLSWLYNIW